MNSILIFLLSAFFFWPNPSNNPYVKIPNGIIIHLPPSSHGQPRQVRLQAVNDKIIHVSASPVNGFADRPSLILKEDFEYQASWEIEEGEGKVVLKTGAMDAEVSLETGQVVFKDKNGKILLREEDNGRSFRNVQFGEESTYHIQQHFKANDNEALYGLGQHQSGLINYRHRQVDLTQYNGVAVVPFMVSTNGYGILWDNYSITTFGDTRPVQPLSALNLYASEKAGPKGLKVIYASDRDHPEEGVENIENVIDYPFIPSLEKMPVFDMAKGIVTWSGFMDSEDAGNHTFKMVYSGYIKIWMDDELKIDTWRESWNPGFEEFQHELSENGKHKVKIEWIPESDQSFLSLKYLSPQTDEQAALFGFDSEAGDQLDYYFIHGEDMDEVISGYRTLTGKAQVMPKWAMGFWQSRERYKTQEELLETVRTFREKGIPLDNIVQDWSYWAEDQWGSHEFDKDRFPDPEEMIREVQEEHHARIMISVWPKYYEGIANYNDMKEKGMLYMQNIENQQRDWIGDGYTSTFYDAYNENARKEFWNQLNESLFSKGIDAWWLDATEPDIHSNASIVQRKSLMNPTALGVAEKYFNAYALMNAKGIYEGQRDAAPDQRVFILTRSAFAGIQRFGAATWSGDISSRFDEMERQIAGGLNFAMSGLPYWTTDIGGFFVEDKYDRPDPQGEALEEWRELNARWYQFGAFTPLFRAHGQYPYREVYHIAPEDHQAYKSILYYTKLRYRLMPYIYSLTGKVYHDDYTIMRALVMDFPEDENVKDIGNQYMFGPSLLINPVTAYKDRKKVLYLPKETGWYDLYHGKYTEGGQRIEVDAPYERMPIYVKAGSILPFGPEIQYSTEKVAEEIMVYVYEGQNGDFTLYEDENTNYNYEEGKYLKIPIRYDDQSGELTFGDKQGESFDGRLDNRTFQIVYVRKNHPRALDFEIVADHKIVYNGTTTTVRLR
ncbi:TIM-barrel domain-containing protein [Anditalea andensis]|uniref:Alpha-xylosidase n=1 Tax=Anditalea andensis TaxID=1048983 RepID=A0A074L1Q5_9BACT|nr:TIM-barrel domain-containing protein [Anditalea andensis]KEO73798.1 alpha-xylosidase [Anditalea andensis]